MLDCSWTIIKHTNNPDKKELKQQPHCFRKVSVLFTKVQQTAFDSLCQCKFCTFENNSQTLAIVKVPLYTPDEDSSMSTWEYWLFVMKHKIRFPNAKSMYSLMPWAELESLSWISAASGEALVHTEESQIVLEIGLHFSTKLTIVIIQAKLPWHEEKMETCDCALSSSEFGSITSN